MNPTAMQSKKVAQRLIERLEREHIPLQSLLVQPKIEDPCETELLVVLMAFQGQKPRVLKAEIPSFLTDNPRSEITAMIETIKSEYQKTFA